MNDQGDTSQSSGVFGQEDRFKFQTSSVEGNSVPRSAMVVDRLDPIVKSQCVASLRRNYVTDNGASCGSLNMSILFVGLLDVILGKMESNKAIKENIMKVVLDKLHEADIFPDVSEVVAELKPLRKHYLKGFWNIIFEARKTITALVPLNGAQNSAIDLQTLSLPYPKTYFSDFLNASKYEDNFEEHELLGRGGFGVVYKARNRVDLAYYAIKKIFLKDLSHDNKLKILREARVIASLKHPNIVCYHTAWLEYVTKIPNVCSFTSKLSSEIDSNLTSQKLLPVGKKSNKSVHLESPDNMAREDISSESEGGVIFGVQSENRESSKNEPIVGIQRQMSSKQNRTQIQEVYDSVSSESSDETSAKSGTNLEQEEKSDDVETKKTSNKPEMKRVRTTPSFRRSRSSPNNVDMDKVVKKTTKQCLDIASLRHISSNYVPGCFALFIQMQLYDSTLKFWVDERNHASSGLANAWESICHNSNMQIFKQIVSALSYMHSKYVIHRDLKLQNIFIDPKTLQVWVGDFGLARYIDQTFEESVNTLEAVTSAVGIASDDDLGLSVGPIGSKMYVAPELQNGNKSYNSKVDMFSLGIVLFELYCPFTTSMERIKVIGRLKEEGQVPDEGMMLRWPSVCSCIEKLVAADPVKRPSADQVLRSNIFSQKSKSTTTQTKNDNEKAKLIRENDLLRKENARLREENAQLQEENARLKLVSLV